MKILSNRKALSCKKKDFVCGRNALLCFSPKVADLVHNDHRFIKLYVTGKLDVLLNRVMNLLLYSGDLYPY
jgi:hypothetical protein